MSDKPDRGPVPPERWSVEIPFDECDWLSRPVPTYEDEPEVEVPPDPDASSGS